MILLAVGGLTCRGLAQAADGVTIECSLSRTRITVGDQVDFQIQVLHPDNYQIGSLPSALDFGKLEILDHRVQNTPPVDGLATTLFLFRMTAFEQECDLVKFAKLEPPLERNQVLLELARNWLEKTRPVPVAGAGIASLEAKP